MRHLLYWLMNKIFCPSHLCLLFFASLTRTVNACVFDEVEEHVDVDLVAVVVLV